MFETKYIILISTIIFILGLITSSNDSESARSVLSVIIPSLASLLAIIISLTLIIVQLSSQNYGTRILKIFVSCSNHYFWILISLFLFTIIYSIFLLNSLPKDSDLGYNVIWISFSILFSIWSLFLIPKYIIDALNRVEPLWIIDDVSKGINENLVKELDNSPNIIKSTLIPLVDIIKGAIINQRPDIAEYGLKKIFNSFYGLIINRIINEDNEILFLSNFLPVIDEILNLAIERFEIGTVELIVEKVSKMGFQLIQIDDDISRALLVKFFGEITTRITSDDFEQLIQSIMNFYEDQFIPYLIRISSDYKYDPIVISMNYLDQMWKTSAEKRQIRIKETLGIRLDYIIQKIVRNGLLTPINSEISFLRKFGIWAVKYDSEVLYPIVEVLMTIVMDSSSIRFKNNFNESKLTSLVPNILKSLKEIGLKSIERDTSQFDESYQSRHQLKGSIISRIISIIEQIGLIYVNKDTHENFSLSKVTIREKIIDYAVLYLYLIGLELIQKKSDSISKVINALYRIGGPRNTILDKTTIKNVLDYLEEIGLELTENESKGYISECTRYIRDLALLGIKNNFRDVLLYSINYLDKISLKLVCNSELEEDSQ